MSDLLKQYTKLNRSFKKTLVFHIGESAGFFSEYNCMILAMLYCLENKIRFVLYSKDANFGYKEGWNDYFEPFCDVTTCYIHHFFNVRPVSIPWKAAVENQKIIKWKIKRSFLSSCARLSKPIVPFTYYTQDLWKHFFDNKMIVNTYDIPELNIKGDLVHACKKLIELTWRFNPESWIAIKGIMAKLSLPANYISCQIRSGDKDIETDLLPVEVYIDFFKKEVGAKNIFVLTDDYAIIEKLKKEYLSWNWYTLCDELEKGYFHSDFTENSSNIKKESMMKLFASVEFLRNSNKFIGTKTSNPSIFMALCCPEFTEGVDSKKNLVSLYFPDNN